MKIATFNVNNINSRLPNLLQWLKAAKPDIVCLQELKCADVLFPGDAIRKAAYHPVWRGQKTWNGVAILSRDIEPAPRWVKTNGKLELSVEKNQLAAFVKQQSQRSR